jgi:hypothetical protein
VANAGICFGHLEQIYIVQFTPHIFCKGDDISLTSIKKSLLRAYKFETSFTKKDFYGVQWIIRLNDKREVGAQCCFCFEQETV